MFRDDFLNRFKGAGGRSNGPKKYPGVPVKKNNAEFLLNDKNFSLKPSMPSKSFFEKSFNNCLHLLNGVRDKKGAKLPGSGVFDLESACFDRRYKTNALSLLNALKAGEADVRAALAERFTSSHMLYFLLSSYYKPEELLFYDIETKSLAFETSIITIGLGRYDGQGFAVKQFTVLEDAAEYEILEEFVKIAAGKRAFVSYNGKSFDVPYTSARLAYYGFTDAPDIEAMPNFDLLHFCRRAFKSGFTSFSLKDMEGGVLGFEREDDISGEEVLICYGRYLSTGDPFELAPIIHHNREDIVSLAKLFNRLAETWKE